MGNKYAKICTTSDEISSELKKLKRIEKDLTKRLKRIDKRLSRLCDDVADVDAKVLHSPSERLMDNLEKIHDKVVDLSSESNKAKKHRKRREEADAAWQSITKLAGMIEKDYAPQEGDTLSKFLELYKELKKAAEESEDEEEAQAS